jgi:hypothetical protein
MLFTHLPLFSFSLFSTQEERRELAIACELHHNFHAYCGLSLAPPVADREEDVAVVLPCRYTEVKFYCSIFQVIAV